jgi:hypothetical protein
MARVGNSTGFPGHSSIGESYLNHRKTKQQAELKVLTDLYPMV